ncbi:hypothetical protein Goklo_008542 [Gossypium klotzschianum]|uniref:RNase H type-1 domain-containing protein n=1 Tax=Gossypium klotzschianum TaxID=34286 RepID=A0A7J8V041_9ROSI|nr:hypothetical protein [Gossypium klotzschianum]
MARGYIYPLMVLWLEIKGVVGDQDDNWIMGFNRQAIIQTDNLEVIQALTDLGLEDPWITVFRRTQRIMRVEGQWRISYMPRE